MTNKRQCYGNISLMVRKVERENTRGSSYAFKKRYATTRLCNTTANQFTILMLDKRKTISTTTTK